MIRLLKKTGTWFFYSIKQMFNFFSSFFKEKVLVKKVLYTIGLLLIFIVGGTITIPGVNLNSGGGESSAFFSIFNIVGGGGLTNFSLLALGISPFITSSLIMMIAQTKIFPPIYRLSQSGPQGRIKINIITRMLTFVIAIVQSIVLIQTLTSYETTSFVRILDQSATFKWFILPLILIAGSMFAMFLGEQITNNGVGNGTSLIIFTGIIIGLPARFIQAYQFLSGGESLNNVTAALSFSVYIVAYLVILFIVMLVYQAERHIPIQQTGAGLTKKTKEIAYLPIKVNQAGVMPLIFSLIVISTPAMITGLLDPYTSHARFWVENNLSPNKPIGFALFIVVNFAFSILMGLQQSRVDKITEDFEKNSTFIPGIRPGEQTEDYLISVVLRLSFFSAIYLTTIGALQYVQQMAGMPQQIVFAGTSMIILVSTSVETISQFKARLESNRLANQRKNVIRFSEKIKKSKIKSKKGDILW